MCIRDRQMALKTPVSRVQSPGQRRDRVRADLGRAQLAHDEASAKLAQAHAEVARLTEQLELAEVEFREASEA
eukprot:1887848-Lingulodinium_polyedra.AAC.1